MKTCEYCGGAIPDGLKFCENCGAAVPVEVPVPEPVFEDPPAQPYQQPYRQSYDQAPAKSATTLIVLSVLEFLFCGGLLAIIPFVLAIQASSAYNAGDIAGGDAKASSAKTALLVILIVGLVIYFALFGMGMCSAMLN